MLKESPPKLKGFDFTTEEIENCIKNNSILKISLALSKICNLKCPFCYANKNFAEIDSIKEISFEKAKEIILQAKKSGAKTITLVGGEPLIYPKIKELISFINSNDLITVIFTNGTLINENLAKFLFENSVTLIVKFNSLDDPEVQNKMVGNINIFNKIQNTISILVNQGFNQTKPTRLAVESVISKTNISQIPKIFTFARENNIYPSIELITPAGRGKEYSEIISKDKARKIFYQLLDIDENKFGYTWIPRPPQVAATCTYYYTSLYINFDGKVQPCPTVSIKLGNINNESIFDILNKSETKKIRNIRENIKGKCRTCEYNKECYGCRGATFNLTGDIFNEYPVCWV
ncbi:MAG: radical SAM protein [Patescibacteria group bacterium]